MGESSNSKLINLNEDSKFIPRTISDILKDVSLVSECSKNPLDSHLQSYENELRKVDAFKQIEKLKEERLQYKDKEMEPIITFPINTNIEEDEFAEMAIDNSEKRMWVSSFELWTTPVEYEEDQQYNSPAMWEQLGSGLSKGKGGAFVAFNRNPPTSGVTIKDDVMVGVDDEEAIGGGLIRASPPQEEQKKQRRCWYPELHRIFVHAVDEIGGAKVATPKKIIEKMKVEGLTSDEVKSHLQKYRIHIRRLASASSTIPSNSQCLTSKEVPDIDCNNIMQEEVVKSKIWANQVDHRF